MSRLSHNTLVTGNVFIIWLLFSCSYFFLKEIPDTSIFSAYLTLIGEAGLDFVAAVLMYRLWRISGKSVKNIFRFFFISFISAVVADATYNIVLNLYKYEYANSLMDFIFDIPFALFLLMQLAGWASILIVNHNAKDKNKAFTYFPYAILSLIMFGLFIFCMSWKIDYFSSIGIFQTIDLALEVEGFALATICLARANTRLIRFMGIGYLMIVSSDFVIRYSVVSGLTPYLSSFETTWVLGLLLICTGIIVSKNENPDKLFQLKPISSLQSQISVWSLVLWLSLISILVIFDYVFFQHYGFDSNPIAKNLLSMLVPISVLVIIISSYFSAKISTPLSRLEDAISNMVMRDYKGVDRFDKTSLLENNIESGKFEIYEVEKLKKFILNAVNDLRKANLVKSEFLMNMSHDFRTPASGILHMSRLVHERIVDDGLKKLQKMIVDSSEQLMTFLDDVLDYSRLDNDKLKTNYQCFDMVILINELVCFMTPKANENKNIITTSSANTAPYYGDREVIHRIILNILSNAIKFTYAGRIDISVSLDDVDKMSWLEIKISDTGVGIDEANHQFIFEPFYRVEPADSAKFSGIGLGLSNVHLMLKKLGGRISLKSQVGVGSVFTIYLPVLKLENGENNQ